MRIAFFVSGFGLAAGGAEKSTALLVAELARRGDDVAVFTRAGRGERIDPPAGVAVHRSPFGARNRWLASASYLASTVRAVRRATRFDVLHAIQAYSPATAAVLAKRRTGAPVVVKVTSSGELGEFREIERLPFRRTRRALLRDVDAFVVLTEAMKAELRAQGIEDARIRLIPNPVLVPGEVAPAARAQARRDLGIDAETPLTVWVGRLSSEKALDVLVEAWARVRSERPSARLALVGPDGGERASGDAIRAAVEAGGLAGAITFTGERPDVTPWLRAADVFVLPSRVEGMSNALLEAMAHGLACVASDIPANAAVVRSGESGVLARVGDADDLARRIVELLRDPAERARLGANARRAVEERFAATRVADRYLELYRELVR